MKLCTKSQKRFHHFPHSITQTKKTRQVAKSARSLYSYIQRARRAVTTSREHYRLKGNARPHKRLKPWRKQGYYTPIRGTRLETNAIAIARPRGQGAIAAVINKHRAEGKRRRQLKRGIKASSYRAHTNLYVCTSNREESVYIQ